MNNADAPRCAGFAWSRPGTGHSVEPKFARNLFDFPVPGSFPLVAVAQATPWFDGDGSGDMLFGACWDAKLEPVSAGTFRILSSDPEYNINRGALDIEGMVREGLLMH